MNQRIREKIYNFLPTRIKQARRYYLLGKMSEKCSENGFIYDRNLFAKLKVKSYSQFGQDFFVYDMIFGKKKDGFFLDIGANDPIEINNSYLLEQNGWKGIAFEPIKEISEQWKNVRETPCVNVAIGDTESEVFFTEVSAHQLSGIGLGKESEKDRIYKVKQKELKSILVEYGITHVDVAFIDVEGYEMNVLRGIDFEKTDITCICIENNRNGDIFFDINIRNYLIEKGYILIARLTIDDVFIKKEYLDK